MRIPMLRGTASFLPATANAETRTVSATFYSGAEIVRFPFWDDPYKLRFSMEKGAVRLGRFQNGANLIDSHDATSVRQILGVLENPSIDKSGGRVDVRFSARPDVEPLYQDVLAGVIRNVSMGARVYAMEEVPTKKGEMREYLATDWEPAELSLVAVPADPGAQMLSAGGELALCSITDLEKEMTTVEKTTEKTGSVSLEGTIETKDGLVVNLDDVRKETQKQERIRCTEIRRIVGVAKIDEKLAETWITDGVSLEDAKTKVFELMAAREQKTPTRATITVDHDAFESMAEPMAVALALRAGIAPDRIVMNDAEGKPIEEAALRKPILDRARDYRGASLTQLAAEGLTARGVRFNRFDRNEIVKLALSTSDFPGILSNVATKILLPAYQTAQPSYRRLSIRQDLPDFKTANVVKVGDFPLPLLVGENGEVKMGSFSESKDTFALLTYGRRIPFTRQMLINDDLNAFARPMGAWGLRLADFENGLWFTLLTSASGLGPTLGDTGTLFNATVVTTAGGHANRTATGTAISVDSLGVGRASMQKQPSLDGLKLNILPAYLLVSPDKRTLAEQYTAVIQPVVSSAVNPFANGNPFAGKLEPMSDANLAGVRWYLFADPQIAPVSVYGYLTGEAGPRVESRVGFEVEGIELKVVEDFGTIFSDFRGAYMNEGA